jgi:redox-sensitive bicupin YhaK (pirin superfamily)
MAAPNFTMFWAEDIPRHVVTEADGRTEITCIVGALRGVDMPDPLPPPSRSWAADTLRIAGESVESGSAIEVDCSVPIELVNGSAEAEILLLQGRPQAEPVVQHGPFVMNSLDEIRRAYADHRNTRFGHWTWGATDPDHGSVRGRFTSR